MMDWRDWASDKWGRVPLYKTGFRLSLHDHRFSSMTLIMSGAVFRRSIQSLRLERECSHWKAVDGWGHLRICVVVSSLNPHVGHDECDCSPHRIEFLAVPQKSEFRLIISVLFVGSNEADAFASEDQAMCGSVCVGMLSFRIQYSLAGCFVSSLYMVCRKLEVIFIGFELERKLMGPYSLYNNLWAVVESS